MCELFSIRITIRTSADQKKGIDNGNDKRNERERKQ